ncbi:MAG: hypothetical protein KGL39_09190 [Patescibacteria group bacterium]|nr:hypothetical protein [Patescibacteria group bacterium]
MKPLLKRLANAIWLEDDPELEGWLRWGTLAFVALLTAYLLWEMGR